MRWEQSSGEIQPLIVPERRSGVVTGLTDKWSRAKAREGQKITKSHPACGDEEGRRYEHKTARC